MSDGDYESDSGGMPKQPEHPGEWSGMPKRRGCLITAKDAGWITPTAFVAPITFVPIDPPRPIKRRRPSGESDNGNDSGAMPKQPELASDPSGEARRTVRIITLPVKFVPVDPPRPIKKPPPPAG